MSSRANKAAALAKMRKARAKRDQGMLEDDMDDLLAFKEEEDVYDKVEEDEYRQLVESRRQREDFVVDDDGLGYYDDGEERLGDEQAQEASSARRKRGGAAHLTHTALKKARKANAAAEQKRIMDQETVSSNKSMWDFVERGANSASLSRSSMSKNTTSSLRNVDSLLEQLDDEVRAAPTKRRGGSHARQRRFGSRVGSSRLSRGRPMSSSASRRPVRRSVQPEEEHQSPDDDGGDFFMDDDANDNDEPMPPVEEERIANEDLRETPSKPGPSDTTAAVVEESPPKDESAPTTPKTVRFSDEDDTSPSSAEKQDEKQPRRRLNRPRLLGNLSAPAKKALMEEQEKEEKQKQAAPPPVEGLTMQPDAIATETTNAPSAAETAKLESFLTQDYLDMFWIDACERGGEILLFGKVPKPDDSSSFVSCCVLVKNHVRNLFVLPRKNGDGEYESMENVHKEVLQILKPSCIPRMVQGVQVRAKPVERQYAFGDTSIPREKTPYLKVVYDAKYKVPEESVCLGGKHQYIDKILGAGASNLENFIVKRKLMGPCWIRIANPTPTNVPVSWCKLEVQTDSPKNVSVPREEQPRPAPPLVSVSIKLKTVVHPKTHKSEIVSLSAICHKQVLLDKASDESARHMTQLTLIRPLPDESGTVAKFPRDFDREVAAGMPSLQKMPTERTLLSRLMAQIGLWDPDVLVGHNTWGYDMEVILGRCSELKVPTWSKIGRRRKTQAPNKSSFSGHYKDRAIAEALSGRILCDTYLSAKELLRETTYSLTNLAETQLKTKRQEIEPVDIPRWYHSSKTIVQLALHTLRDVQLVQNLMFKLQILPLTKQLTCIAGNLWSHTVKGNRAERNEYLLLHEFHRLKFLAPEKKRPGKKGDKSKTTGKAKYSGGLVLEPKKGLYDTFILLLDFNSLYPSIIQEYNLCFTTMDWSKYAQVGEASDDADLGQLPPVPDESVEHGVLPRVIKSLVDRRRTVKKMLKGEKSEDKREELDIRQKALKLTANSMYGCLGFSNSRFYAQPIAALVTAMGRETLQRTVEIAQNTIGLDVIYGDTDSIMINTRLSDMNNLDKVKELGNKVKKEVNRLYKTLELEIDGIFKSMLLLKKKKYAAVTIEETPRGIKEGTERKGLDLVRRDWCIQSKETGAYVLDQILSGKEIDAVVNEIHSHLSDLAKRMRSGELPLEKFVITKGLSKHPTDYPDAKSQPHVLVAQMMLKNNMPVNTGDHIPYVITTPADQATGTSSSSKSAADRARHPDEIKRSGGVLKPDVEWYLTQQILQPIARLCEPIDGTSQSILAGQLGLDASRYNHSTNSGGGDFEDLVDYTPAAALPDEERFKDVEKLKMTCMSCGVESEFPGVFCEQTKEGTKTLISGLQCVNPNCDHPAFWGYSTHLGCLSRISNAVTRLARKKITEYYQGPICCDDCKLETRQLSVAGGVCLRRGCNGQMVALYSEQKLHTQLKYLETLFSTKHASEQKTKKKVYGSQHDIEKKALSASDGKTFDEIHGLAERYLHSNAYNWVAPSLWQSLFGQAAQ